MGTTLRVAGGWVRDKLVGQEQGFHQRHLSKVDKMDIDIALDNCMGGDFAGKLQRYLSRVSERDRRCVFFLGSSCFRSSLVVVPRCDWFRYTYLGTLRFCGM